MTHQSNPSTKGPHIKAQPKGKGPITGNRDKLTGTTRPWSMGKGKSKNLNFGKDVKKS